MPAKECEANLKSSKENVKALQELIEKENKKYNEVSQANLELQTKLNEAHAEWKAAREENDILAKQIQDVRGAYGAELDHARKRKKELEDDKITLAAQFEDVSQEKLALERRIAATENKLDEALHTIKLFND